MCSLTEQHVFHLPYTICNVEFRLHNISQIAAHKLGIKCNNWSLLLVCSITVHDNFCHIWDVSQLCVRIFSNFHNMFGDTDQQSTLPHTSVNMTKWKRNDGDVATHATWWNCETEERFVELWQIWQHPCLFHMPSRDYHDRVTKTKKKKKEIQGTQALALALN